MSLPAVAGGRCLRSGKLISKCARGQRRFTNASETPKDPANIFTGQLLSKNFDEERSLKEHYRPSVTTVQSLRYLAQSPWYKNLSLGQRFYRFRDIVARCEVEGYDSILQNGVRRALSGNDSSVTPSKLLRDGEKLLRAPSLKRSKWTIPMTLDTIGLEDADSTILSLLPAEGASLEEHKRILRAFNAFTSRIMRLELPVTLVLALEGQYLAANAHSIDALARYAEAAVRQSQDTSADLADLGAAISSLRLWILTDAFEGETQRAALSALFARTGSDSPSRSTQNFRSQFISLDPRWRWEYLDILRRLHGPQEVLAAWSEFQTTPRWDELVAEKDIVSTTELSSTLHDIVEQLVIGNEPQLAWIVVHSLGWEPRSILSKTWSLLLDYPEYLTQMTEGMRETLLRIYEEKVQRIEEALGVQWTGGEDGVHLLADGGGDIQALVEDVNVSEETQKD